MSQPGRAAYLAELHRGVLDKRHPLDRDQTIIGRDLEAHIRVDDGSVSRKHAAVERRGDRYVVRDLGSRNGTMVNEHHLRDGAERALAVNDCLFVGKAVLCFMLAEERMSAPEGDRDPLTGVANRQTFLEQLTEALSHARSARRPLALSLVGIEDLRGANDRFGQEAGDAVLCHVARVLTAALAPGELIGRYRGAVFGVISPGLADVDGRGLVERAERLRAPIEAQPVMHGDELILVGVSVGVAAMSDRGGRERLLQSADVALSSAKQRGGSVERAAELHFDVTAPLLRR